MRILFLIDSRAVSTGGIIARAGNFEGLDDPVIWIDIGTNYYIHAHNAKFTLEYRRIKGDIRAGDIALGDGAFHRTDCNSTYFYDQL